MSDHHLGKVTPSQLISDCCFLPSPRRQLDEVEVERGGTVRHQPQKVVEGREAGLGLGHVAVSLTPGQPPHKSRPALG